MNIEQTISLYLDGELSSEQEAEFHHLLSVSPEARSLFREHMKLQSIARDEQTLLRPEPELRNSLFSRLQAEGMAAAALPGGFAPTLVDEEDLPGDSFRGTTEQVRHRRNSPPMAMAADRAPIPNQEREEEKRRRRLIPILIPTLLLAVAGSILWLDWRNGTPSGEEQTIATADVRGVEERGEGENATDQGMIDRGTTRSTPAENAPTQVDADNPTDRAARSTAQVPTAATPRPSARSAAASPRPREESVQPVVPQQERSFSPSDVLNPSENTFAHSIPPDENVGGLSDLESLDGVQVHSSLSLSRNDDSRGGNGMDAPDDMAYAEETDLAEYQRSVAPSTLQSNARAARDRMSANAPQQMADSVYSEASVASVPDPTFAVAMGGEASRSDGGSIVSIIGHDEDGESITPLLVNRDEILASLRERGIFIGHDGTFSFTPPAEVDSMAVNFLSSIRFDPDDQSPPVVIYQATAEKELALDREVAEASDASAASEPAGFELSPLDAEEDRTSGFRPFIAIEGSLNGSVSNSPRSISWVYDDPVTQTSSVKGEILLKGSPGGGFLLVAGLAPYEERSVTYNALAAGPVPPVSENVLRDRREFWAGVGGRYIVRLTGTIATGLEGIVGVGQKRFHAGISVPVSWSLTEKFAVEFIPHVRYRNAHAPLRPTTGTDRGYQTIQGPADDEELSVGTGIGLILLLY